MVARLEKRTARRQAILDAAVAAFTAEGFRGAGVAGIAAAAGIAPANLYRYFRSKDDMVQAIVAAQRQEIAGLHAASASARSPRAAFLDFLAAVTRRATSPAMRALWLEILAEAARNPAIADLLRADNVHLTDAFAGFARDAVAAGEIAVEHDPIALARIAIALMDGLTARAGFDAGFKIESGIAEMTALMNRALNP